VKFPVYVGLGPVAVHPHWVFETLAYSLGSTGTVVAARSVETSSTHEHDGG